MKCLFVSQMRRITHTHTHTHICTGFPGGASRKETAVCMKLLSLDSSRDWLQYHKYNKRTVWRNYHGFCCVHGMYK